VRYEGLEVLIVEGEEPVTDALASTLARRGHRVSTATSAEKALALPAQDVIVCEGRLPGSCGFELLSAVKERGDDARFVILLGEPTVDECVRALRLGANDLLAKPFRIEDLVRAVEGSGGKRIAQASAQPDAFDRAYPPTRESVERSARELCVFAMTHGVPPSARARIACAAEEIVHNAVRHGGLRTGATIRVRAGLEKASFRLRIADPGVGFDTRRVTGPGPGGPARTGIARARALSEAFSIRSTPGSGTEVELAFSTSGAELCAAGRDLSEVDFLALGEAEALIGPLLEGRTPDVEALSPALAVVIGRLLAGAGRDSLEPRRDLA
jgi:ActR/RegA family two-component response regulator